MCWLFFLGLWKLPQSFRSWKAKTENPPAQFHITVNQLKLVETALLSSLTSFLVLGHEDLRTLYFGLVPLLQIPLDWSVTICCDRAWCHLIISKVWHGTLSCQDESFSYVFAPLNRRHELICVCKHSQKCSCLSVVCSCKSLATRAHSWGFGFECRLQHWIVSICLFNLGCFHI